MTNNRIKSGYENRVRAPIDMVPSAGARAGHADGIETTEPGIANSDLHIEDGDDRLSVPSPSIHTSPPSSTAQYLSPQHQIPHLRV